MKNDAGWVVDASVALKWYLWDGDHVPEAALLYEAFAAGETELTAPSHIRYDIASALELACLQGRVKAEDALRDLASFLRMDISLDRDSDQLLQGAIDVSHRYRVAPCDGLYLALAEDRGFFFVTADSRLYRRIDGQVPYAHWIGDLRLML